MSEFKQKTCSQEELKKLSVEGSRVIKKKGNFLRVEIGQKVYVAKTSNKKEVK